MSLQVKSLDGPKLPSCVIFADYHHEDLGTTRCKDDLTTSHLELDAFECITVASQKSYPPSSSSRSYSDCESMGTSISSRSRGHRHNCEEGNTFGDRDYTIRSSTPVSEWNHAPGYKGNYDELSQLGGAFFDREHTALGEPPYLTLDTDDINHDLDILRAGGKGGGDWPPMADTLLGRGHRGRWENRHDLYTQHRKGKKYGKYFDRDGGMIIEIAGRPVRTHSRYRSHSRHRA